jgi:hypothetical protein
VTEGDFRMPTPGDLMARRPAPGPPVPGPPEPAPAPDEPAAETPEPAPEAAAESPDVAPAAGNGGTGGDRVDAALRRLESVDETPVSEHVAQYDAVHRALQDALATIDEG